MEVIDSQAHAWFLLTNGQDLFLDVNCSHSAVSYAFLLQLSADEQHRYEAEGKDYLTKLVEEIQNSTPGVAGSHSAYANRNMHQAYGAEVTQAILLHRQTHG